MTLPVVAVAGATGNLGFKITNAFLLPEIRGKFHQVIVLARAESQGTRDLVAAGAKLRVYDEDNLAESLSGVNVLVNVVGPSGHAFKERLLRCLPQTCVTLYLPSEFGVNHYIHDFPHEEWDAKKRHYELAKQVIPHIRICRVYAGLLLEDSIGPWFGFFTKDGRYEAVGSPSRRSSYISKTDIGRALASLASLATSDVPEEISLEGDSKSFEEIAALMEEHGAGEIDVESIPLEAYKEGVLADPSPTPERYLRFLMGEGKIDHSGGGLGNGNEVVARGGVVEWATVRDLARKTGGKPWATSEW